VLQGVVQGGAKRRDKSGGRRMRRCDMGRHEKKRVWKNKALSAMEGME